MNPRINENGCFTLPLDTGNWLGFSTDEDKSIKVNITTIYIRGSEVKNAWVQTFYLMFSQNFGNKFECYQNCTGFQTNLTDTNTIITIPVTGLDQITDIRLYPTAFKNVKSMRVDF